MTTTLQVVLGLATQVKPLCPHTLGLGEWGQVPGGLTGGLQADLHSLSGARFLLVMGHDPQLVDTRVPCVLSSHFSFTLFSLPPLEFSFSSTDLITPFLCLRMLKKLLALPGAYRAHSQVPAWCHQPGTPWPQRLFNVPPDSPCMYPMAKSWFSKPNCAFLVSVPLLCCSPSPGGPSPPY